jgi:hypothetical protein
MQHIRFFTSEWFGKLRFKKSVQQFGRWRYLKTSERKTYDFLAVFQSMVEKTHRYIIGNHVAV